MPVGAAGGLLDRAPHQLEGEARAAPGRSGDARRAARAFCGRAHEGDEDALLVGGRHAGAFVVDGDDERSAAAVEGERHLASVRTPRDGVAHQVAHGEHERVGVALERRVAARKDVDQDAARGGGLLLGAQSALELGRETA